jgi:murein DD-endopeptidase MepM/ murein hydrolase activator NlpD
MFYKVLFLEILACTSMVSLKVYHNLPETSLTVGETTLVIKATPANATESARVTVAPPLAALPVLPLEDVVSINVANDLTFPVAGYGTGAVISVFGDKRGKTRLHKGIDIKAPRGTAVVAATDGVVERIRESGSGGKQLYLRGTKSRLFFYAHLDDWSVKESATVKAGDVIGTVGNTGNAKGTTPHLHFEVMVGKEKKAVDPLQFWVGV